MRRDESCVDDAVYGRTWEMKTNSVCDLAGGRTRRKSLFEYGADDDNGSGRLLHAAELKIWYCYMAGSLRYPSFDGILYIVEEHIEVISIT